MEKVSRLIKLFYFLTMVEAFGHFCSYIILAAHPEVCPFFYYKSSFSTEAKSVFQNDPKFLNELKDEDDI